jgi:hypothetical protein
VCPACARAYPASERFCPRCALPLVFDRPGHPQPESEHGQPLDDLWRRARRIKPQFSEGELVRVVGAGNQTEADFIQGLLLEEGIPSMQRRSRGFDVPDFLAAGPRDILVPASGVLAAREVLLQSELLGAQVAETPWSSTAWRVMAGLLLALTIVAIVVWLHP